MKKFFSIFIISTLLFVANISNLSFAQTSDETILIQLNNLQIKEIKQNPEEGVLATFIVTKASSGFRCSYFPNKESERSRPCPRRLKNKILKSLRQGLKVNISEETELLDINRENISLQDFQVGDKINVYGELDKQSYEIDALIVRKLTKIPPQPQKAILDVKVLDPKTNQYSDGPVTIEVRKEAKVKWETHMPPAYNKAECRKYGSWSGKVNPNGEDNFLVKEEDVYRLGIECTLSFECRGGRCPLMFPPEKVVKDEVVVKGEGKTPPSTAKCPPIALGDYFWRGGQLRVSLPQISDIRVFWRKNMPISAYLESSSGRIPLRYVLWTRWWRWGQGEGCPDNADENSGLECIKQAASQLYSKGVRHFEVGNEMDINNSYHREMTRAFIEWARNNLPGSKIWVNLEGSYDRLREFVNIADYVALHALRPGDVANIPSWLWRSGKLELSTDGQYCGTSLNCAHVDTTELLNAIVERLKREPADVRFEADFLLNGDIESTGWVPSEWQEFKPYVEGQCKGPITPVPPGGQPSGDLKINGSDGPVRVSVGQSVTVSWSAIPNCQSARWEQRHERTIISGPYSANLGGGSDQDTIRSGATSFTLTCNNPFKLLDVVSLVGAGGGTGGGESYCVLNSLSANPPNPSSNQSVTISWSMTCNGQVEKAGIEQISATGDFEEFGPTGLFGRWQRGPYPAGTTKQYCTYYYVNGVKYQAGNCINVNWTRWQVF